MQPLEPSPATDYTVIAENQDGSSTFTFSIEVQAKALAVNEVAANVLKVYPNPAKDTVTLSGMTEASEIILLNTLGQEVKKITATAFEQTIDLARSESGMYICKITNIRQPGNKNP